MWPSPRISFDDANESDVLITYATSRPRARGSRHHQPCFETNATHVATRELKTGALGVDGLGDELMRLVAQARAAGFDPGAGAADRDPAFR
jgi:hypothetical protein